MKATLLASLCVLTALSVSADLVVSTFTSGNPGDGLEFSGTYDYAVNLGGRWNNEYLTIGNASFNPSHTAEGVTVTGTGQGFGSTLYLGTSPVYAGDTTSLDQMTWSGFWSWGVDPSISLSMAVTPGNAYRLHLLFSDNQHQTANAVVFDISVEGSEIISGFAPIPTAVEEWGGAGQPAAPHTGVMVSYDFTAADSTLNVALTGSSWTHNPFIQAMALETVVVPEPSSVLLIVLGLGVVVGSVRRRAC